MIPIAATPKLANETGREANGSQMNRPMPSEDLLGAGRLVVKSDISTTLFHESDFLFRAGGGDDFQAVLLGYLSNKPGGRSDGRAEKTIL